MSKQEHLLETYHDAIAALAHDQRINGKSADLIAQTFISRGLQIRYGRWTIQEKRLLNENFERFVEENVGVIGDPVDFIVPSDDKGRAYEVNRLKKELSFLRVLSTGLFREAKAISTHIFSTLDPLAVSNGQEYSVEDLHLLKSLVDRHGRRWKIISQEMGRSVVSVQSAHRNFFLHEGYTRNPPTRKQSKKLAKEMQTRYPDTDFSRELVNNVPWNEIANKIGYLHGKYLHMYWESQLKHFDSEGKLRLISPIRPPPKLIRRFVKHATRQNPTHLDGLDWPHYYQMFAGYIPGAVQLKAILPALMRKYKIDLGVTPFPTALQKLHGFIKRTKKLGFQSIWKEINEESVKFVRWQQYHWALSPGMAHFVHDRPIMYQGFAESSIDPIKQEVKEFDEVW
ncbi:uncharacterized protein [Watersipora subatra]|uniref:uncharacterized protein n=1 Tax=Watersipora subatra TaxID=2589382 RepID=UPI00355B7A72